MAEAQDTFSALGMDPGSDIRQDLYKDLRDTLLKKYNSRTAKPWYYMIREMNEWRVTVQDMPSLLSVLEKDKPEIMRNLFANIKSVSKQGFKYVEEVIELFKNIGIAWPEFEIMKSSIEHERAKGELPSAFSESTNTLDPDSYEEVDPRLVATAAKKIVPDAKIAYTDEGLCEISALDGLYVLIGASIAEGGYTISVSGGTARQASGGKTRGRVTAIIKAVAGAAIKEFGTPSKPTTLTIDDDRGHGVWQHIAQNLGMEYETHFAEDQAHDNAQLLHQVLNDPSSLRKISRPSTNIIFAALQVHPGLFWGLHKMSDPAIAVFISNPPPALWQDDKFKTKMIRNYLLMPLKHGGLPSKDSADRFVDRIEYLKRKGCPWPELDTIISAANHYFGKTESVEEARDPSPDQQIRMVQSQPSSIGLLDDPGAYLQLIALKKNPAIARNIRNTISSDVWDDPEVKHGIIHLLLASIKGDRAALDRLHNTYHNGPEEYLNILRSRGCEYPELDVIAKSMAHNPREVTEANDTPYERQLKLAIGMLDEPTPDDQRMVLKKIPYFLKNIRNPITPEVWNDPEVKHSVVRLLLASIKGDREALNQIRGTYDYRYAAAHLDSDIPRTYLKVLRDRGCPYPELDVVAKSLDASRRIANEAKYQSQNPEHMKMHQENQVRFIGQNLESMERDMSSDDYRGAHQSLSLAMYPIHDLGPGDYASEMLEQHKSTIIRVMLWLIKTQTVGIQRIQEIIMPGLRMAGMRWPELDVIQQSMNAVPQLANEDLAANKRAEAEMTARSIGVTLHRMEKAAANKLVTADGYLVDAMYLVHDLGRTNRDLVQPMIEHYKSTIIKLTLMMIKSKQIGKVQEFIMPALRDADVRWPELDIINKSLNIQHDNPVTEVNESTASIRQILILEPWQIYQLVPISRSLWNNPEVKNAIMRQVLADVQNPDSHYAGPQNALDGYKDIHADIEFLISHGCPYPEMKTILNSVDLEIQKLAAGKQEKVTEDSEETETPEHLIQLLSDNPEYVYGRVPMPAAVWNDPGVKAAIIRTTLGDVKDPTAVHDTEREGYEWIYENIRFLIRNGCPYPEMKTILKSVELEMRKAWGRERDAENQDLDEAVPTQGEYVMRMTQNTRSFLANPEYVIDALDQLEYIFFHFKLPQESPELAYLRDIYDKHKPAVVRYLLEMIKQGNTGQFANWETQLRLYMSLLTKSLGLKWPELAVIKQSLNAGPNESVAEAKLSEAPRMTDSDRQRRVEQDASSMIRFRNPSADLQRYFILMCLRKRLWSNTSNPLKIMLHQINNFRPEVLADPEVKTELMTYMLTDVRLYIKHPRDLVRSNTIYRNIRRLQQLGADWPELDTIKASLDVQVPSEQQPVTVGEATVDEAARVARLSDEEWIARIEHDPSYFWQTRRPSLAVQQAYIKEAPTFKFLSKGKNLNKISPELYASVIKRFPRPYTLVKLSQTGNAIPADVWADPEVKSRVMPKLLSYFKANMDYEGWFQKFLDDLRLIKQAGCPWHELDVMIRSGEQELSRIDS